MPVSNPRPGAAITISLGRAGEAPDFYPSRIVGQPQMVSVNGRLQEVAKVISLRTNLAGEHYLQERPQNLAFAFDRSERIEALDGSEHEPKAWQTLVAESAKAAMAFAKSRQAPQSVALDEIADLA